MISTAKFVSQVQQWVQVALFGHAQVVAPVHAASAWRVSARPALARSAIRPLAVTPFRSEVTARVTHRSYARVDPRDRRRAVICGSPAQVCAALERIERAERR